MRINQHRIFDRPNPRHRTSWFLVEKDLKNAINQITWPHDSKSFTINPTVHGNGVSCIKPEFINSNMTWNIEVTLTPDLGPVDLYNGTHRVAIEWETGNISSCHRALNKLALAFVDDFISIAVVVIPSTPLSKFLTDRVTNFKEIAAYLRLPKLTLENSGKQGIWEIWTIDSDSYDANIPLIPKGTTGYAKRK